MDRALVDALAHDLATAGYAGEGVAARIGVDAADALGRMVASPARRALGVDRDALATLVRLLWLGDRVPVEDAERALGTAHVAGAAALGIVETAGDDVVPRIAVRPHAFRDALGSGSWWIASDLDELSGVHPLRPDHVLGVGGAARTLAAILPPVRAGSALDLGSGCGIVSLHLARIADRVVATDLSERALAMTRLTCALNGVDHVETRAGDLWAPVDGERFDLIASNPPFVVTPRSDGVPTYEYRDGGRTGDALMQEVVEGLGAHLRPGGAARLLGNWESGSAGTGLDRVRSWVVASDVDGWVLERETLDVVRYAELWLRDGGTRPGDVDHAPMLTAWLDDFAERGVHGIGLGWVAVEARSGVPAPRVRVEHVAQPIALEHAGAHLQASLDVQARLATLSDDALRATHLVTQPDVTEVRHLRPGATGPSVIELVQGGALGRTTSVDTAVAALVGACDGELSIGAILDAIASLLDADAEALSAGALPAVRELWIQGVLVEADEQPSR
ncbi:methyltransferase [Agrococcus versicolor]|uniref:Methyltransferase n=1 Tax=Agrococcus versicolor TaxID=501482 RepID=A0ABN3AQM1_9MICO